MFSNKYTKHVASFVIAWLGLCFIFPQIPGITYTGGIFEGLGLTILNLVVMVAVVIVAVIIGLIGGIAFAIRNNGLNIKPSTVTAWILKQGFWKVTIGGSLIGILLSSITWKITAGLSSSLTIDGWVSIIIGTTILSLISFVPKYLSRPSDFTEEHFREELNATLAKEQAEEQAAKQADWQLEGQVKDADHKDGDK